MPDRRRQRQQRVRHDVGGNQPSVGESNRDPEKENTQSFKPQRQAGSGVAYAEPKEYESVTIMPDKEVAEPQTYHRREVLSNWSRYEEIPTDEPEEGEDYLMGEDFSLILEQQANSGGGHLRLKGESSWDETETNILTSHGLGALRVADLVASINTIPLYTQLNIPEESLPESVMEFYMQLAEDNRKLYQPSSNYSECNDVNEKILQSLIISESEPLDLASEMPESSQCTKNAVDVALSLTSAFAPEPEDVDLDTLLHVPSVENPSPVHQPNTERMPSPEKKPTPERQPSPKKQPSPEKEPSPEKQPFAKKQPNLVINMEPSLAKQPTPVKEVPCESNKVADAKEVKQPGKARKQKSNMQREKSKEKSPTSFDFGLSKKATNDIKPSVGFNFGVAKTDTFKNKKSNKANNKVSDAVELLNSLPSPENTEEVQEGPTIDLDAPAEQSKPVLLISKTEAEDLEDWLDSVLDD